MISDALRCFVVVGYRFQVYKADEDWFMMLVMLIHIVVKDS